MRVGPLIFKRNTTHELQGGILLVRFVGGCKPPNSETPRCGAGVVAYKCEDGQTTKALLRLVSPLPQTDSAQQADGHASVIAQQVLCELGSQSCYQTCHVLIQGDNLGVINYWRAGMWLRSLKWELFSICD